MKLHFLGALGLIGFFAAMFLPETLYRKLPNTLSEAKKFGKDQVVRSKFYNNILNENHNFKCP